MFVPSEGGLPVGRRTTTSSSRPSGPPTKWDYAKTFYYDPAKWNFVKSVGFFALAIYIIRDFSANDLIPME